MFTLFLLFPTPKHLNRKPLRDPKPKETKETTRTPKGMPFGGFYVPKNLHNAYLWGSWQKPTLLFGFLKLLSISVPVGLGMCDSMRGWSPIEISSPHPASLTPSLVAGCCFFFFLGFSWFFLGFSCFLFLFK